MSCFVNIEGAGTNLDAYQNWLVRMEGHSTHSFGLAWRVRCPCFVMFIDTWLLFVVTVDDIEHRTGTGTCAGAPYYGNLGKTERKARWMCVVRTPVFRNSIVKKTFFYFLGFPYLCLFANFSVFWLLAIHSLRWIGVGLIGDSACRSLPTTDFQLHECTTNILRWRRGCRMFDHGYPKMCWVN